MRRKEKFGWRHLMNLRTEKRQVKKFRKYKSRKFPDVQINSEKKLKVDNILKQGLKNEKRRFRNVQF